MDELAHYFELASEEGYGGFLVNDNGEKHLPTEKNGKPDRKLAGAAWAALFSPGGHRGKKYEGPDKAGAKRKLKALYKRMGWPEPGSNESASGRLYVELEAEAARANKPFDGLVSTDVIGYPLIDYHGREVTTPRRDLPEYVKKTRAVIESTKTESGEIVGLPIDMDAHDHKGGAGYIVDVSLDVPRSIIKFTPKWTDAGLDLITGNVRRFFSAAFDPEQKVILGGTMTNNPASRDENYNYLLRPIELSEHMFIRSDSMGGIISGVVAEFNEQFGCPMMMPMGSDDMDEYFRVFGDYGAPEVYSDHLIAVSYDGDDLWKVPYSIDATTDEVTFADRSEWTGVKITYEERPQMIEQTGLWKKLTQLVNGSRTSSGDQNPTQGVTAMPKITTSTTPGATVAELVETPEIAELIERRANDRANQLLLVNERKQKVAEFSKKLVGGAAGKGNGLVNMPEAKLAELILGLPEDKQDEVMGLLEKVMTGVVDFKEKGHAHDITDNKTQLPPQLVPALKTWLASGRTMAAWFEANPEAGKAEQFDLTAYEPLEKKEK